jgi:hypothetical protein
LQPTLRRACGTLLAVCSLGAVATLPAAGAGPPTGLTTVEWSGGLVFSWTVASSTADPKGIPGNKAVTHLNWDAKAVVTGDDLYNGKPVRWHYSKLEGSYSYDTTEPRAIHCSVSLKEKPGYEATNFDLANITYNLGTGEYQVTATAPFDTNALTTGLPQNDPCGEIAGGGIPQPGIGDPKAAELGKAITPTESVRPGGPYLFHYNASWQSPDQISTSSQVSTDLTISAGLTGISPQPITSFSSTPELLLEFARADWLQEVALSMGMNIVASSALNDDDVEELKLLDFRNPAGVASIVSLWLQTKAMRLYLLPTLTDAYATEIKTLTVLENVLNDPPLPDYRAAARVSSARVTLTLPSCLSAPIAAQSLCAKLSEAASSWATSLSTAEALEQTLATDVGRESSARKVGDSEAVARLETAELALLPRAKAAVEETGFDGSKLAIALQAAGFHPRFGSAQVKTGISELLADLAKHGLTAAEVTKVNRGPLPDRPLDLITLLH